MYLGNNQRVGPVKLEGACVHDDGNSIGIPVDRNVLRIVLVKSFMVFQIKTTILTITKETFSGWVDWCEEKRGILTSLIFHSLEMPKKL